LLQGHGPQQEASAPGKIGGDKLGNSGQTITLHSGKIQLGIIVPARDHDLPRGSGNKMDAPLNSKLGGGITRLTTGRRKSLPQIHTAISSRDSRSNIVAPPGSAAVGRHECRQQPVCLDPVPWTCVQSGGEPVASGGKFKKR
jgi:hypothetical protein